MSARLNYLQNQNFQTDAFQSNAPPVLRISFTYSKSPKAGLIAGTDPAIIKSSTKVARMHTAFSSAQEKTASAAHIAALPSTALKRRAEAAYRRQVRRRAYESYKKLWNIALMFLSMALTVLMCCLTTPTDNAISAIHARQPILGVAW